MPLSFHPIKREVNEFHPFALDFKKLTKYIFYNFIFQPRSLHGYDKICFLDFTFFPLSVNASSSVSSGMTNAVDSKS